MGLYWHVFVAAKIIDMNIARELEKRTDYEIFSIKGDWYIRDKYLMLETRYPGSVLESPGIIQFLTSEGPVQAKFDVERLSNFTSNICKVGWELNYWETFISGTGTPYRLLANTPEVNL